MSLTKTLAETFKRMAALRQVGKILRAQTKRQAKGPHVKLRQARQTWIRDSQLQAIEIANDRRLCRKEGRLRDHIMGYYNNNRYVNGNRAARAAG